MNPLPVGSTPRPQERHRWLRRALIALPLLCLLVFGTLNLIGKANAANAASLVPIQGEIPSLVKTSTLVGAANSSQSLSLSVGLQLRNVNALKAYADNSVQSSTSQKPQHLTSAQIGQAFAPLASSQQSVIAYLQSYGFTVTKTLSQHLVVDVQGTVADAENAFHIQINNYHSAKGQNFYAPASDPSVPASLAGFIQNIAGLDNSVHYSHASVQINQQPKNVARAAVNSVSCLTPRAGYYLPSQIATAYNLNGFYNSNLKGEGQTVGLIEYDDYLSYDINTYTSCYGGSSVPINKILVDGGPLPYGSYGNSAGPDSLITELDMELILSAAPRLAGLDVYEAPQTTQGSNDMWAQIINNDSISVVSTDWGVCEANMTSANLNEENSLFALAATQGQTIVAATGDTGTNGCRIPLSNTNPAPFDAVEDPASQPYVTGVGGTNLTLNNNDTYQSETVWNIGAPGRAAGIIAASGGGISNIWPMPTWQQGPGVNNGYSSGTPCGASSGYCREVPDVSLNAGVTYPIYCNVLPAGCGGSGYNGWYTFGGTDIATPMWAAFMALANELSQSKGGFNIGFANPYLYQIDQNLNGTSYANDFHDVTSGNNDGLGDGTDTYTATADYDMATGLGSYNAWNLGNDLEKLASAQNGSRQAPANTTWYFAEGSVFGSANFQEYLILFNPSTTQTATVNIKYLFQNGTGVTVTVPHTVAPGNHLSVSANSDVNATIQQQHFLGQQPISAIVTSAVPIVAERTMYFNYSTYGRTGNDVLGATDISNKTFYFAFGDSTWTSNNQSSEFITILNPDPKQTATITATYYANGKSVGTSSISVGPLQRGTTRPPMAQQASVVVTSNIGVVIERVQYSHTNLASAGGWVNGSSTAVGATTLGNDWLHAEGHEGSKFQEYLVASNFTSSPANVTFKLEFANGYVLTKTQTVAAHSSYSYDTKAAVIRCGKTCGPISPDFSSDVSANSSSIVVERFVYFQGAKTSVGVINGVTDAVGEAGPASHSAYTFAEGYTDTTGFSTGDFTDYLLIQNPTKNKETVVVTFFADNTVIQQEITMQPDSRYTIEPNSIVVPIAKAYPNGTTAYEVSMEIQALNGGTIVAERAEYFDRGGTDILGYTSN